MKTYIYKLSWLVLIMVTASCNRQSSFLIDGEINAESEYIYLQSFRNKMFFISDSAKIRNGKFSFKGNVERPDLFGLTTDREETFQPHFIFIENSNIKVEIDQAETQPIKVKGSSAHDLYESYLSNRRNFNIDSFIVAHPASTVPAYILYRDFSTRFSAEDLERSIGRFDPSLDDLDYIAELKEVINARRRADIGNEAIEFSLPSPEGDEISLSDFRGNYVLLEFWASWCAPCRRENPGLMNVYNKYNKDGFEILAISLDSKRESWLNAIEQDQLTWYNVSDLNYWDSEPARLYSIRHIPANVLIDPAGKIIAKNLKEEELNNKLEQIYAQFSIR